MLRFNKCRIASIPRIYVGSVGTRREWLRLCGPARDGRIDGGAYRGRGWLTRYGNRKWRCLRSKQPQAPSPGLESCDTCFISWHLRLSLRSRFLDFIFYLQGLKFWLAIWAWKGGCGEFASFSVRFSPAPRGAPPDYDRAPRERRVSPKTTACRVFILDPNVWGWPKFVLSATGLSIRSATPH